MAIKKGQIIDLNITDIAFGGKGLAKPDGFVVFVDRAVPEDVIRARIVRKKKIMPKPVFWRSSSPHRAGYRHLVPTLVGAVGANGRMSITTHSSSINNGMFWMPCGISV